MIPGLARVTHNILRPDFAGTVGRDSVSGRMGHTRRAIRRPDEILFTLHALVHLRVDCAISDHGQRGDSGGHTR